VYEFTEGVDKNCIGKLRMKENIKEYHRFVDEAGDSTFYLKGKKMPLVLRVYPVFLL
jgi:hypothetical protein